MSSASSSSSSSSALPALPALPALKRLGRDSGIQFLTPRIRTLEGLQELDFLEALIDIRENVYARRHPRLQVQSNVLPEQKAPVIAQKSTPPVPKFPGGSGTSGGSQAFQPLPPRPELPTPANDPAPHSQPPPRPFSAKSASSGIDPVLLTKSDNLIKAEQHLKRRQVERALKDQSDQWEKTHRARDAHLEDRGSKFDILGALAKAHALVKPISGLQPIVTTSDEESFDENSYYSSQANSWSSDREDASGAQAQLTVARPADAPHRPDQMVIDLDEDSYEPTENIQLYEHTSAQIGEESDESDYSPPPAEVTTEPDRGRKQNRSSGAQSGKNGPSRRQSPGGNPPAVQNPRKRRRDEKKRQQASKRVVRSPEPQIKLEPESPPPVASLPDAPPHKRRAIEPDSPRSRYSPFPSDVDVVPRGARRVERDDTDLRRAASLQNARQRLSPGESVYRDVSIRPSAAPQYTYERPRSPVQEYVPRGRSPMFVETPVQIVVDQYGNRYYANPINEDPAPQIRRIDAEPYYDRRYTRESATRAASRELYEDVGLHSMPPPPPPRRYIENSDRGIVEARQFRQREPSHRPQGSELARVDHRPVIQYAEMAPPRAHVPARAYSVRPEVVRREAPGEFVTARHESIQPRYVSVAPPRHREFSVVRHDHYDDPRYTYSAAPPTRRYVEESDANGGPEIGPESPRRVVTYRY